MGIFDNEKTLPGVITQIESDYTGGFDSSQFGSTDSVCIIGTAFQGPTNQLTQIFTPEHAAYIFGKVYDAEKDQEATLVANIQDAWERGCRTIYAVRVGGKELYKDFDLCIDSNYKLRVSSMFPTNIGKQCYFKYDNTIGMESLRFYKPASQATIAEKKQGYVTSASAVLATEIKLNQDYGYNRDSNLIDVIKMFNYHANNNVLKLSIVDEEGNDVTNSSGVRKLPLGVIYPGVYFIGRDHSLCQNITEKKFTISSTESGTTKPFTKFEDPYYRTLVINTDVNQPLPIYAKNMSDLRDILYDVDITMVDDWDFLDNTEIPDRAFALNDIDYEGADISGFDLYKALGSGFAITAKAEKRIDSTGKELTPRIRETAMDDPNRIVSITDGVYSMLQDANMKYRVLSCASADEKIDSKLPRAIDFKKAIPQDMTVLNDYIKITSKVDSDDKTEAKTYTIQFVAVDSATVDNVSDIYSEEVYPVIGSIDDISEIETATLNNGTLLMLVDKTAANESTLIRMNNDSTYTILNGVSFEDKCYIVDGNLYIGVKCSDSEHGEYVSFAKVENISSIANKKEYILGDMGNHVFVYKILSEANSEGAILEPLGDLKSMLSEDESVIVYAENLNFNTNKVIIKSTLFNDITLNELIEIINQNEILNKLFEAEITSVGSEFVNDFILDILKNEVSNEGQKYTMPEDRKISYDYNMYIPYRTTDNFARQFNQHCTYTELKTAYTHGIIGCERITNLNLKDISNKVNKLLELDYDLYAKNGLGRNMLDRNNLAYPIGRNLTVVFGQTNVVIGTDNDYNFTSNCAASYAGMISTLPLDQSSTNQPIAISEISPVLTQSQLEALTAKGIVTFKRSFTKGIVVTDGITMAPTDSVFRRLSVSRIMGAVEEAIRQAAEPYIGKQNHSANRNSLHTAITSKLDKLQGTLIESYSFTMSVDPTKMQFGNIDINYSIVPIYEIRTVNNTIKIKSK